MKKKIAVFTGAGISVESGIEAFRSGDKALWANHSVDEVATPRGWKKDPEKVTQFYNDRRMQLASVNPNPAHEALAELESQYDVTIITQNVDDLHERAGSSDVQHLHGDLKVVRSVVDPTEKYDYGYKPVNYELDRGKNNARLRPDVVWFEEMPDERAVRTGYEAIYDCDILLIIGTSLQITYTVPMLSQASLSSTVYYIDPNPAHYLDVYSQKGQMPTINYIRKDAVKGVCEVVNELMF
mgnify:CR=1 FL=1